jgi:hypothetical protein
MEFIIIIVIIIIIFHQCLPLICLCFYVVFVYNVITCLYIVLCL